MRIVVEMTGRSPLLMHNEQLSDKANKYTRQIKEITDKKKNMTEKDEDLISLLEWHGGLYVANGGNNKETVVVPSNNVVKCLRDAGAITKNGTDIRRALSSISMVSPLSFPDDDKTLEQLFKNSAYIDRRQVGIGRKRVKRTRPIFPKWSLRTEFEYLPEALDFDRLQSIADVAGAAIGLGDARVLGFGRFEANVKRL